MWVDIRTGKVIRPSGRRCDQLTGSRSPGAERSAGRLVVDDAFSGSIGVVTPFRAQANRIRALVHQDRELSQKLAALQFVVDTVHGFQGDERDIIFFSPVVSAGTSDSAIRFLKSNGNLFNVAITRARSELVVVGDRQAAIHSDVNYLAGFAEYSSDLASQDPQRAQSGELSRPESNTRWSSHPESVSDWERLFYKALYAAELR